MNLKLVVEIVKSRRKTLMVIVSLLLLNLSCYAFVAFYQKPRLDALQKEMDVRRKSARGKAVIDAADIYAQGTRDLAAWRERIIPKKEFSRFLGELFELSAKRNLVIKGVTYKPVLVKEENLLTYGIAFNVSGKYSAIKSFIAEIGNAREIVTIDAVNLSNSSPTEEAINLNIQITTYLRMEGV
jgi:type IV pilus assembly protein PilO